MSANSLMFNNKAASTQTYTSGSGNWTVPSGVYQVWVELIGGGGKGGSRNTATNNRTVSYGGEAGQTILTMVPVTPGDSISYSVGTGGTSITDGIGQDGSNTTFGSLRAGGGKGGGWITSTVNLSEPDVRLQGLYGQGIGRNGFRANGGSADIFTTNVAFGGDGNYGAGGNGSLSGTAGNGGVGAGGGASATGTAGNGGNGRIQIWWIAD